jgi:dihydrolipoamide dehydrogenase
MVGPTEEQCIERAKAEGWTLGKSQGNFRANSKALAEGEGQGIAKVLFNKDTGKVVAVHIIGLHAADLIQECANAVAAGTTVQELSMMVVSMNEVYVAAKAGRHVSISHPIHFFV